MGALFKQEHLQFAKELREFIRIEMESPTYKHFRKDSREDYNYESGLPQWFMRRLGKAGYLGLAWPKRYGGQGRGMVYHAILNYEMSYALVPAWEQWAMGVNVVGPAILGCASEDQRSKFLPGIAKGETIFCIGYSEPQAGSDLVSLQTRAIQDGDEFIINGEKLFTTNAHNSHYMWLAARTDPSAGRRGISVFIVDMKTPGLEVVPYWTIQGWQHNGVVFREARVPANCLVGELNRGWEYVSEQLKYERIYFAHYGYLHRMIEELVKYIKTHSREGARLALNPYVRAKLAQLIIDASAGYAFNLRVAEALDKADLPLHEIAVNKLWGSELVKRLCDVGIQICGLPGLLTSEDNSAPMQGALAYGYLRNVPVTIGGGASQIQRNIIATHALGLPR